MRLFKQNRYKKKPNVDFLVFWLGQKCSLKCKLCCNLIPYLKQNSYETKDLLRDFKFIAQNNKINLLQIQGGEPFTHPDIVKILDFISSCYAGGGGAPRIEIATNATICLKQDVLDCLKRNSNMLVRISNYTCCENARNNFIKKLEQNGISYEIYGFLYGNDMWFSTGGVNERRAGDEEVEMIYKKCENKGCTTLVNGVLSVCGKIASIKELYGCYDTLPYDEVNVRAISKLPLPFFKKYILRYHLHKFFESLGKFKQQCRFCRIANGKFPAAEQLNAKQIRRDLSQRNLSEMKWKIK